MRLEVLEGDCVERMRELAPASVDAVCTDPPYGLEFMGKGWDRLSGQQDFHEAWAREALRVLKPGGHLLAFGGSRTSHRLVCAVEDAGFEIRDSIMWLYGSGFPKSLNLSGEWEGWGTALKPAHEPIVMARKPLAGTVVANVLAHGTGAVNVAGCRVGFAGAADERESKDKNRHGDFGTEHGGNQVYGDYSRDEPRENYDAPGRWPANVVLSHAEGCDLVGTRTVRADGHFPAERGASGYGSALADSNGGGLKGQDDLSERHFDGERVEAWECVPGCPVTELDRQTVELAGASRFFYVAKASRAERSAGLDGFEKRPILWSSGEQNPGSFQADGTEREARNPHPTVKPVDLMRWLVRLVTPPAGIVLDPFAGSGTTGIACALEGFSFVGIERAAEYVPIARARIAFFAEHGERALRVVEARRDRERVEAAGQEALFS